MSTGRVTARGPRDGPPGSAPAARVRAGGPSGISVVVVDDHELFSSSLTIAFRDQGIAARNVSVARLREFASQPMPGDTGVVVLDLDLGWDPRGERIKGHDWVRPLRIRGWQVLIVSGTEDAAGVALAVAEGASGVVPKSSPLDVLLYTVLLAASGEPMIDEDERAAWMARHEADRDQRSRLAERMNRLTTREREVLELIADGQHAAMIARRFVVSLATVRTQIRSVLGKLEVNSQLEAVALIRRQHDS